MLWLLLPVWLAGSVLGQTNTAERKRSSIERLQAVHLKATHEDAVRLQEQRRTLPPLPGLHDYKGILHAHAEDSSHTGGTRPEMLADAKKAGVQVILLTDHLRPPRDFIKQSWRGLYEGVLFIPGSEARGFLVYPMDSIMDRMDQKTPDLVSTVTAGNGLIFLSHIEERKEHSMEGLTGMEICNRHYDAKKDMVGLISVAMKLLDPDQFAELKENVRLYPDEALAGQVMYPEAYMTKWNQETLTRRLTGVAANDCHHNQVLVVKMVDESTVLLGTNVDKDEDMRRFTADGYPGIKKMTAGRKPGDILATVDFDPYYRSFRNMATHILATVLTEEAIRAALQQGHAYVSHDWMCDATGFSFVLQPATRPFPPASGAFKGTLMGDEIKFAAGQKLSARFPVKCRFRLLQNGKILVEDDGEEMVHDVSGPGVYRVEGWLSLDGELRPWIYSNPIYVR